MSNAERRRNSLEGATRIGKRQAERDRDQEMMLEHAGDQRVSMPLDRIISREHETREVHQDHVLALAESIAALGLIEPIVVDRSDRLLAGGHRFAALKHLREHQPTVFTEHFRDGWIPVRIMSFDAQESPEKALSVEVAENEQRRDYTRPEVLALAERLRIAGYHHRPGRVKKGDRALAPALMLALGKSRRTVARLLTTEKNDKVNVPDGTFTRDLDYLVATRLARAIISFRSKVSGIQDSPYRAVLDSLSGTEQVLANLISTHGVQQSSLTVAVPSEVDESAAE